jgi:hypothetical protein
MNDYNNLSSLRFNHMIDARSARREIAQRILDLALSNFQ